MMKVPAMSATAATRSSSKGSCCRVAMMVEARSRTCSMESGRREVAIW